MIAIAKMIMDNVTLISLCRSTDAGLFADAQFKAAFIQLTGQFTRADHRR